MARSRSRARIAAASLLAIALSPALPFAADAVPTEKDPVARRARSSSPKSCAASSARTRRSPTPTRELAQDLRRQIREQIAAGKTDDEIVDYMVARYGDFVLYQPPVKATTLLLWAGPALLLVVGLRGPRRTLVRARRAEPDAPALTTEERERAARLLAGDGGKDRA